MDSTIKNFVEYQNLYQYSIQHPEEFWGEIAQQKLHWFKPWHKVLHWDAERIQAEWFQGAELNVSYNCLDRHLKTPRKNKAALIWEGEQGQVRTFSYAELHQEVVICANMLKKLGINKGDTVAIYLPLIPELVIAMLACARIGAIHVTISHGFSVQALKERINDSGSSLLITADGGYRNGHIVPMKAVAEQIRPETPSIRHMLVVPHTKQEVAMRDGRDMWWHWYAGLGKEDCPAEPLPAEHPLFIFYASGATSKAQGIVHTSAGYLLGVTLTTEHVFNLQEDDVYWCSLDPAWITGHGYIVYGPLSNGATVFLYEGTPIYPKANRYWRMVEQHKISILYTSPMNIRTFMRYGNQWPEQHDLSSLRILGTVGEPISPEAWAWFHGIIGKGRCPLLNTWGQIETGMIMVTPLPGITELKPGGVGYPFFGVDIEVIQDDGKVAGSNTKGVLCIKQPWPAMARAIKEGHEYYQDMHWTKIPGVYYSNDGAYIDTDGCVWIVGRIDDIINISGHRIATLEIENAIKEQTNVAECIVVPRPDPIKGQGIVAFIVLKNVHEVKNNLKSEIQDYVVRRIGLLALPDDIRFISNLPKAQDDKVVRTLLRQFANEPNRASNNKTTIEDLSQLR